MEVDDDALVAGIVKNDYACFNDLFVSYYGRLCVFVFGVTQSYSDSEDIVQELFIRLWINRAKLDIRESVSGYLYKSSKNAALNYLRAEKSRQKSVRNVSVEDSHSDANLIEEVEFGAALYQCIEQLPSRSREVFKMSRLDGVRHQEISDQLGISVKTIKNQLWKSLQYLKACLELKEAF